MKFNEKHLESWARQKEGRLRAGYLRKAGEHNPQLKERYFVLKWPFLFYFKGEGDNEPLIGFVFLGQGRASPAASQPTMSDAFAFQISFRGEQDSRAYLLVARSPPDMHNWINVINDAISREGAGGGGGSGNATGAGAAGGMSPSALANPASSALVSSSLAELSLGKKDLTLSRRSNLSEMTDDERNRKEKVIGVRAYVKVSAEAVSYILTNSAPALMERECFVQIAKLTDSHSQSVPVECHRTEPAKFEQAECDHFKKDGVSLPYCYTFTCSLPVADPEEDKDATYKIQLSNGTPGAESIMAEFGSSLKLPEPSRYIDTNNRWILRKENVNGYNYVLELLISTPLTPKVGWLPPSTRCRIGGQALEIVSQSYQLPYGKDLQNGKVFLAREILTEAQYTFYLPVVLLRFLLKRELDDLKEFKENNSPPRIAELNSENWLREAERGFNRRKTITQKYLTIKQLEQQLAYFDHYKGPCFRSSKMKKDEMLQMIPINCHLHTFLCRLDKFDDIVEHNFVTVGAFAAHSFGFSKGGMKSLAKDQETDMFQPFMLRDVKSIGHGHAKQLSSLVNGEKGRDSVRFTTKNQSFQFSDLMANEKKILMNISDPIRMVIDNMNSLHTEFSADLHEFKNGDKFPEENRIATFLKSAEQLIANAQSVSASLGGDGEKEKGGSDTMDRSIADATSTLSMVRALVEDSSESKQFYGVIEGLEIMRTTFQDLYVKMIKLLEAQAETEEAFILPTITLRLRGEAVFSQALTALTTSFVATCNYHLPNQVFISQLTHVGFVTSFESLLTAYSNEIGMLEDMDYAVDRLQKVGFQFSAEISEELEFRQGYGDMLIVVVRLPAASAERFKSDELIRVWPLLFTQGVNEIQTFATRVGRMKMTLQHEINEESFSRLEKYVDAYKLHFQQQAEMQPEFDKMREHLNALKDGITKNANARTKNIEMFDIVESLMQMLNGGRITSCKSAKDRTSMQVTLKEARILRDIAKWSGPEEEVLVRDILRSRGVRVLNACKNTGSAKFAFNALQRINLPHDLRPPRSVARGGFT